MNCDLHILLSFCRIYRHIRMKLAVYLPRHETELAEWQARCRALEAQNSQERQAGGGGQRGRITTRMDVTGNAERERDIYIEYYIYIYIYLSLSNMYTYVCKYDQKKFT